MEERKFDSEQWKHEGICRECRRKNYCKKQCSANAEFTKREIYGEIFKKMVTMRTKKNTNISEGEKE